MVEIQIQRRPFCQDTQTRGKSVYKHFYFNLFHPTCHFLSFWSNINLLQRLKTLPGFSGVLTLKEKVRWICFRTGQIRILSLGVDELFNLGEPSALRIRKLWYSSVQPASSFQDYRRWHYFLQGSYWNLAMGNELLYLLLRAKMCKLPRAHRLLKS